MSSGVYIGVGHGGYDPGAVGNGLKEKDLALVSALACEAELKRHGVRTMVSRRTDISESTAAKAAECNEFDPAVCHDFHYNAGGGDGAEIYCSINGGTGRENAEAIAREIKAVGQNLRNPAVKTKTNSAGLDYFGFIRLTNAPANIIEFAFIDNAKDIAIADTVAEQQALGIAVAKADLKTLNIPWIPPESDPKEKPVEKTVYRIIQLPMEKEKQLMALSSKENAEAWVEARKKENITNLEIRPFVIQT